MIFMSPNPGHESNSAYDHNAMVFSSFFFKEVKHNPHSDFGRRNVRRINAKDRKGTYLTPICHSDPGFNAPLLRPVSYPVLLADR